ncbi:SGNH/GDSL hydrolase family protein [Acinetobacter ursingii]|uniref:SGNH/GDSL hydrolase family protein n=1 Tax=Acinetobacter ursingii TaxID=108980 RepID=UPI00124F9992|nr:SGNH/GDSL hydrolase family protein [Acinetobacter ursingii]
MATNWNAILSNTNNLQDVLSILKKVLASLDIKADITTIDEALTLINSLDADVQEKLSDVTAAITKFNNTGGFISAPTLDALQAITPEYDYQVARVDATGDEYRWNIDALPEPTWEPTGRNFLEDTKKYVNENITSKNILRNAEYYTSFFVNVVDNVLSNAAGFNNVLTVIIAVQPNKTYNIQNFNVTNTDAFSIHESSTKSTVPGFAVSKANYFLAKNGNGAVKTSANTNYLYVNITFLEYSNKDFSLSSADDNVRVFGTEIIASSNITIQPAAGLGRNIAIDSEFGVGKVVNLNADNVFDFTPFTLASLAVESGKKYRFYCDNYLSTAFVVAFRANDSTDAGAVFFRKTVDQIDFNSDGSFDFTVPDGMNHFLFNIHYSGDGEPFDILNSVVINEYLSNAENVASIFGIPLVDLHARQLLNSSVKETDLRTTTQEGLSNNLIDTSAITVGKVILIDSDNIVSFSAYSLLSTQVEAGKKYRFYADIYVQNGFVYAFRPDSSVGEGVVYGRKKADELTLNSDGSFDFTVPSGMTHFLFNIRYTGSSNSFDITNSATLQEYGVNVEQVTAIKSLAIADLEARQKIKELESGNGNLSPLYEKRWLAIGDSITDYSFRPYPTYKNFTQQLAEKHNMTVYNYGQSGTGFYGRYNALDQVTQSESDIDFVTVFLGTNDWGNIQVVPNNKPLGVFGDTGTNTVSGCINTLFDALLNRFPSTPVYILCPLPRSDNWGINAAINQQGYTLFELVNLLKLYAQQCNFAVLDMYSGSNFKCQTTAMKNIWTVNGDGVHPTLEAHTKLLPIIENFLNSCAD